jgi:hypothetical protein
LQFTEGRLHVSILNVFVTPDRAMVAVDTEGLDQSGARGEIAKLFPLAHLNAILAFRGSSTFAAAVACEICAALGEEVDDLPARLEAIFPVAIDHIRKAVTDEQFDRLKGQNVVLLAYSSRLQRIIDMSWSNETGVFLRAGCGPIYAAPWYDSLSRCEAPTSPEKMAALAMHQCEVLREKEPTQPAGGRLICAELGRDGIKIFQVCELPLGSRPDVSVNLPQRLGMVTRPKATLHAV